MRFHNCDSKIYFTRTSRPKQIQIRCCRRTGGGDIKHPAPGHLEDTTWAPSNRRSLTQTVQPNFRGLNSSIRFHQAVHSETTGTQRLSISSLRTHTCSVFSDLAGDIDEMTLFIGAFPKLWQIADSNIKKTCWWSRNAEVKDGLGFWGEITVYFFNLWPYVFDCS